VTHFRPPLNVVLDINWKKNPYKTIDVVAYDFGTKLFIPLCDYIHHLTLNIFRVTTYMYMHAYTCTYIYSHICIYTYRLYIYILIFTTYKHICIQMYLNVYIFSAQSLSTPLMSAEPFFLLLVVCVWWDKSYKKFIHPVTISCCVCISKLSLVRMERTLRPRNPQWKGRISTVHHRVLYSSNMLLLLLKIRIFLLYKIGYLNAEVNCTEPYPSLRVPWQSFSFVSLLMFACA
jgi:hypothetical protein